MSTPPKTVTVRRFFNTCRTASGEAVPRPSATNWSAISRKVHRLRPDGGSLLAIATIWASRR